MLRTGRRGDLSAFGAACRKSGHRPAAACFRRGLLYIGVKETFLRNNTFPTKCEEGVAFTILLILADGKLVTAVVIRIIRVTLDPMEPHLVFIQQIEQTTPEFRIFCGFHRY